jgi:hypothetical protein
MTKERGDLYRKKGEQAELKLCAYSGNEVGGRSNRADGEFGDVIYG